MFDETIWRKSTMGLLIEKNKAIKVRFYSSRATSEIWRDVHPRSNTEKIIP